jgi:hypothetical protein
MRWKRILRTSVKPSILDAGLNFIMVDSPKAIRISLSFDPPYCLNIVNYYTQLI